MTPCYKSSHGGNHMKFYLFVLLVVACPAIGQHRVRVAGVEALINIPETQRQRSKLVIIAPAKKYTMEKPLFTRLARILAHHGHIVVRFNWGFVSVSQKPSRGLAREAAELDGVVEALQKKFARTKDQTVIVAKSFGSRVLMRGRFGKVGHVALVTPNCDAKSSFRDTYGTLFKKTLRINISISIDDHYCDIEQVYDFMDATRSGVTLYTTYGDHNFKTKTLAKENEELALLQIANWIRQG